MTAVEMRPDSQCPNCAAPLPATPVIYSQWCDACEWNIGVEQTADLPPDRFARIVGRLDRNAHGAALRDALVRDPSPRPPRAVHVAAQVIAWCVLASVAAMVIGGIVLFRVMPGPFSFCLMLAGFVCAGLAYGGRVRRSGVRLDEAAHPALFSLVREVARVLGATMPRQVRLDEQWNASFLGGPRSTMTLGLPFVLACSSPELVALIGHELAHGVNHDPRRRRSVLWAINVLVAWADALVTGWSGRFRVLAYPGWVIAQLPLAVARLLWSITLVDSQRAEYFADLESARVAGSDATLHLLSTTQLHTVFDTHRYKHLRGDPAAFFDPLPELIAAVPDRERERRLRLSERSGSRVDATHPPTAYRRAVVAAHPVAATVTLDEPTRARIDAELAVHRVEIARRLRYGVA